MNTLHKTAISVLLAICGQGVSAQVQDTLAVPFPQQKDSIALRAADSTLSLALEKEKKPAKFTLLGRTNILTDLVLTAPNLGLEFQTKSRFSFLADYTLVTLALDADFRYHSFHAYMAEGRYYLPNARREGICGHHFGIYGQMATYDFMYEGEGYQCKPPTDTYAVGVSYGYMHPLSDEWYMDFTIGVGFLRSRYAEYEPYNDLYIHTDTKILKMVAPTRAEISLVWKLNNNEKGKGKKK